MGTIRIDAPKKPTGWGCRVLFLFLVGIVVLFLVCGVGSSLIGAILIDQQWVVPGDAAHFDPVAQYDTIRDFVGADYRLFYMEARYVRADGTLDLNADYEPEVEYRFIKEVVNPAQTRPIGAGGSPDGRQWDVTAVTVSRPFALRTRPAPRGGVNISLELGMDRNPWPAQTQSPGTPIGAPTCSLKQLWDAALEREVPREAVAVITYTEAGYTFRIEGLPVNLRFDRSCALAN